MNEQVSGAGPTRILVIDDSNTIRRSAEIFLKQGGHEVALAEDGFDALANFPVSSYCQVVNRTEYPL